jgi:DHA3 family tetracycline resistance protein-like MFS transporter
VRALLASRDFRLLFAGRCVSLLGDGAFLVAMAWEAYTLSDTPTALSLLGIAMAVPLLALLLVGGIASDRYNRRRVMLTADALRALLLALIGTLALSGALRLWQMLAMVAIYGAAQAFFDPASDAILPELLPAEQLGQANALDQLVRPLALRMAGPALGGLLVGTLGPGAAFLADAATFLISAVALGAMAPAGYGARSVAQAATQPPLPTPSTAVHDGLADSLAGVRAELREGWRYVRGQVWLWGTFASAAIAYLLFMGPSEVLLPFMVKHVLRGSGLQLGLVLGAGGLGSVGVALAMTRGRLPARSMTFIFGVWTFGTLFVAGYGLAIAIWQLMLASLAFNLLETAGTVVWATVKQQHVPGELLGRVSSLDWLISIGLLPVSLALTGPVSAALGVRTTLIAAGLLGAVATLCGLLLPGMRAVDYAWGALDSRGGTDSLGAMDSRGGMDSLGAMDSRGGMDSLGPVDSSPPSALTAKTM